MLIDSNNIPYLRSLRGQKARNAEVASRPAARTPKLGMSVRVLREGVFNDPFHRSLPWAHVGDEIEVASGAYGESLIKDGFVESLEVAELETTIPAVPLSDLSADELEALDAQEAEPVEIVGTADWAAVYSTLDVSNSLKRRLWDAGYTGSESLRQKYLQFGLAPLLELKGVNRTNALKIMVWAGELEEILVNDLSEIV